MNVQELIKQCLSGNPGAQQLLFNQFVTPMTRLCIRYLKNNDLAMDAMLTGFMNVYDSLTHFEYQGEHSLAMWIRKIMVNQCLMQLRKDRTHQLIPVTDHDMEVPEVVVDDFSAIEILQLIGRLPAGYRTVFNLYAIDGYSHKEISAMLNISESASRSQLTHARAVLRNLLQKNGWAYEG